MGLFDEIRLQGAAYRLTEEALYAEAFREMEAGLRRDGLWAKALSESEMNQTKAQALYIKLRVQALRDEITALMAAMEQEARELAKREQQAARVQQENAVDPKTLAARRAAVAKIREEERQQTIFKECASTLEKHGYSLTKNIFGWTVENVRGATKFKSLDDVRVFARSIDFEHQQRSAASTSSAAMSGSAEAVDFLNAVRRLDMREVERMLKLYPVLLNVSGSDGQTALHIAVRERSLDMVEFLIERGIDTTIVDSWGKTPRAMAIATKQIAILEAMGG